MASGCVERFREWLLERYPGGFSVCIARKPPYASEANDSSSETWSGDRAGVAESVLAEEECMVGFGRLKTAGTVFSNPNGTCSSVTMAGAEGQWVPDGSRSPGRLSAC